MPHNTTPAQRFQAMCRLWSETASDQDALDWLAAHVGRLVAEVQQLRRDVARLQREVAQREQRRSHDAS